MSESLQSIRARYAVELHAFYGRPAAQVSDDEATAYLTLLGERLSEAPETIAFNQLIADMKRLKDAVAAFKPMHVEVVNDVPETPSDAHTPPIPPHWHVRLSITAKRSKGPLSRACVNAGEMVEVHRDYMNRVDLVPVLSTEYEDGGIVLFRVITPFRVTKVDRFVIHTSRNDLDSEAVVVDIH